jgi:tetratricopeptide (TPR) repeat protein
MTDDPDPLEPPEPEEPAEPTDAVAAGAAGGAVAQELLQEAGDLLSAGKPDAAAAKCREAIEIAPDLVAAYSLLGMAEEQRGNTVAAAGAYRRVLQLDPDRKIEREKLEALYAEGAAARPDDEDAGSDNRVLAWAPWVAAIGAAFVVMTILTFVGVTAHQAKQAENTYAEQMQVAEAALESRNYATAHEAFEAALAVRPDDDDAQRGLRYAQRKMTSRRSATPTRTAATPERLHQAAITPSRGPNPFPPMPIGRDEDQADAPEPQPGQPPRTQPTRSAPPRSMANQRVEVSRDAPETTTPDDEIMPFEQEGVLETPSETAETTEQAPEAAEAEALEEEESQGEITIWRSPRPSSETQADEGDQSQQTTDTRHADRAYDLRRQAQSAISQGNCERGEQLLDQAIEQYRADSEQNPARAQANQAAISTCQALRQQCTDGEDQ